MSKKNNVNYFETFLELRNATLNSKVYRVHYHNHKKKIKCFCFDNKCINKNGITVYACKKDKSLSIDENGFKSAVFYRSIENIELLKIANNEMNKDDKKFEFSCGQCMLKSTRMSSIGPNGFMVLCGQLEDMQIIRDTLLKNIYFSNTKEEEDLAHYIFIIPKDVLLRIAKKEELTDDDLQHFVIPSSHTKFCSKYFSEETLKKYLRNDDSIFLPSIPKLSFKVKAPIEELVKAETLCNELSSDTKVTIQEQGKNLNKILSSLSDDEWWLCHAYLSSSSTDEGDTTKRWELDMPGGKRHPWENTLQGMSREVGEEVKLFMDLVNKDSNNSKKSVFNSEKNSERIFMKPPNKNFVDVVNIEAHANITNTTEDTNAVAITSVSVKDDDNSESLLGVCKAIFNIKRVNEFYFIQVVKGAANKVPTLNSGKEKSTVDG